jgi:hypothetical protein
MHPVFQRIGVHVIPVSFYGPVPDTRDLSDSLWQQTSSLPGVDLDLEAQAGLLSEFAQAYKREYDALPVHATGQRHEFHLDNDAFGSVDAEILYCMIRKHRPKRVFEIGAGYSTLLAAQALLVNSADGSALGSLTSCEPYPNETLKGGFPGLTRLLETKVQDVPLSEFEALDENDVLFIDSSHVLKIGSDVRFEYLEILPRVRPGVLVHVHDIFLPAEYPRDWVLGEHRFWNEQYLVQAFLAFNSAFRVLWAGSAMNLAHPESLGSAFKSYRPGVTQPGSLWIQRIR